ncbi:MAG TPA: AMP-binding protein, partial [Pseudomonadales bacterium]|nr:AMP-binding protein [Pseudomonadales bacterium]
AIVVLDEFPITANGKLDRAALPLPNKAAYQEKKYAQPESEVECLIAQIWQELLHVENVGLEDNFFELGGHSLLVVNMISQLKRKGYHLEVRHVFAHPTLAEMAKKAVVTLQQDSDIPENKIPQQSYIITPEMLPLVRLEQSQIDQLAREVSGGVGNIKDIYPLAPLQEGILFHHILEQKGDPYLLNSVMAFKEKSLMDSFLGALQQVIDRHDILRSSIHWQDLEQPVQVVWRHAKLATNYVELDGDDKLAALIAYLDPANNRINLRQAPLLTTYVTYEPRSNEWLLGILNHHIACDHVTLELIFEEITLILQGHSAQLPVALPYRSFIVRSKQQPTLESESFFKKLLADVHEPTTAFGVGALQTSSVNVRKGLLTLSDDLCGMIREAARVQGVTPAVLFHVAWAKVLGDFSQRQDVVFGTVLSGRLHDVQASHRVLGMFINTLPIRIQFEQQSLANVIQSTYQLLSDLLLHEQTPLSSVQRCTQIPASLPLFTTLLNYRHTHEKNASKDILPGIQVLSMDERTNYPVSVSVDDFGHLFQLSAMSAVEIEPDRLLQYFEKALSGLVDLIIAENEQDIASVTILPEAERELILGHFGCAESALPKHRLAHHYFEEWAIQTPDQIAVQYKNSSLTYGELNRLADALAIKLADLGVKPDDRVVISFNRGLEVIVAILAVLKAGGAYVPVDPDYPADRQEFMLRDSAPAAIITHKSITSLHQADIQTIILLDAEDDDFGIQTGYATKGASEMVQPQSSGLAYVIYTSGSTGIPKGVMIEHQNLCHLIASAQHRFAFDQQDRWALFHSIAFDFSVWEMWGALANGGRLIIVPLDTARSAEDFNNLALQYQLTVLNHTPSEFRHLFATYSASEKLGKLRYLFMGAESLDQSCYSDWISRQGIQHNQVVNLYGPTEATVCVTAQRSDKKYRDMVPIGYPLPNCELY